RDIVAGSIGPFGDSVSAMFFFLPLGHDQSVYGRQWITWSLIGLNTLIFVVTFFLSRTAVTRVESAMRSLHAMSYEYPDARVHPAVFAGLPGGFRREFDLILSDDPEDADEPGSRELTREAKKLVAAVESVPSIRFGYRPGKPSAFGFVSSLFIHGDHWHLAG